MRWCAMLGLTLLLALGARIGDSRAAILNEVEPNECECQATPGGNAATTGIAGTLTDGDFDYYRFDLVDPVPVFAVTPVTPAISGDPAYRVFDLVILDDFGVPLAICDDCWYDQGQAVAFDLPGGTYYVAIGDASFQSPGDIETPTLGLGAYTLDVAIATPEPASLGIMALGLVALAVRRRG